MKVKLGGLGGQVVYDYHARLPEVSGSNPGEDK